MGNISNVCCEGPVDLGNVHLNTHAFTFEQCNIPELDNQNVKARLAQLAQRPLDIPLHKYENIVNKGIAREVVKGFVYDGTWKNDLPQGVGNIIFSNGQYFQGEFKQGQAEGKGRYIFSTGDYFEGDINDNKAQGSGRYIGNQIQYDGLWENSRPTVGKYVLKNNKTIVTMKNQNQGQIEWDNQNKYYGQISNFLPHGKGKMFFNNGNTYDGEWKYGSFDGEGIFKWPNGKYYQGHYSNGIKQGRGQFVYSDSKRYVGDWRDGKQHGFGKLIENGQETYAGKFQNGVPIDIPQLNTTYLNIKSTVPDPTQI